MKKIPFIHIILFIATFITTLAAGALQLGINILSDPWRIVEGLPFAGTLMLILLCHEFAHYIASYKHHTEATLPYFIPAPSFIGTFGAFIKMKSPIITRRALIDIGASGPIVGFVVSLAASIIGLSLSDVAPVINAAEFLKLGDSILFNILSWLVIGPLPAGHDVFLHPIGFAGWIGMFITALNLLPIGQLDGGHIVYALAGHRHRHLSIFMTMLLLIGGLFFWEGWLIWGIMMLILGIKHPPVIYWEHPLDSSRVVIGVLSLIIFIITFIPAPFRFD